MRAAILAMLAPACVRPPAEAVCPDLTTGDLVVTEVRGPQKREDALGAWIELFNASGRELDLRGVKLRLRTSQDDEEIGGVPLLVRRSLRVGPGTYTVLGLFDEVEPPPHVDYGFAVDFLASGRPWPAAGAIHVEACGATIDRAPYDPQRLPQFDRQGTYSLGGIPDALRNDLEAAWCVDATQVGAEFPGTPRSRNITCP